MSPLNDDIAASVSDADARPDDPGPPVLLESPGLPVVLESPGLPVVLESPGLPAGGAPPIFRGVRRALAMRGYASLTEFRLANGRRADVLAIDEAGGILIIEVKSGVPDFRSDQKWQEYRDWCDAFYFAVDDGFPTELIPPDCGLMVADAYGAEILREAPVTKLAAARRKTLLLRAAMTGAGRLHRIEDPMFTQS